MEKQLPNHIHWVVLPGLPGTGPVLQFHLPHQPSFREGLVLEVVYDGQSWIGNFQADDVNHSNIVLDTKEGTLFVVASGLGYRVPVAHPQNYEVLNAVPITYSHFLPSKNMLVVATFTDVLAYGTLGPLWSSGRIALDHLLISSIDDVYLTGTGWDPALGGNFTFRLSLDNGRYEVL